MAVRTAREARAMSARRRSREAPLADVPAPADPSADPDALRALDEEVGRLPDHLRSAVVLCELDGLGRRDAADRLGVPEGTVSSRLAKARKLLAARLRSRGVALGLAVGFARAADAGPVPAALADAAVGLAAAPESSPAPVAVLADRVFRTMFLHRLKAVTLALTVGAALAGLAARPDRPAAAADLPAAVPVARRAPAKPAPHEGVILVTSFNKERPAELFKPDGTSVREPSFGAAIPPWLPRLSPDGKRVLTIKLGPIPQNHGKQWTPNHLHVFDLDAENGSTEAALADLQYPAAAWSPDGTKVYVSHVDPAKAADPIKEGESIPLAGWVYDLKTKAKDPLGVPPGHGVGDVSPDGKKLLTAVFPHLAAYPTQTFVVPLDTLKPRRLTDRPFWGKRFSPDGKRVLGITTDPKAGGQETPGLAMVAVADGTVTPVVLPKEVAGVYHACWSPDGKRIAYHWSEEIPQPPGTPVPIGPNKWYASRVNVADPDGSNAKTILRREYDHSITGLDWR